ncbi:MAG: hypothetical protein PUF65_00445 [Lachnospiraceae bacterium]|nr:hypothetical protein [Lachnospiraceae bacterium]
MKNKGMETNMKNKIVWFLGITFILPLICGMVMSVCTTFQTGIPNLILFAIEGASPTIAAIVVQGKERHEGVRTFLSDKFLKQFSVKYSLMGFFIPAIVLTLGKVLSYAIMDVNEFVSPISAKKILIISWAL